MSGYATYEINKLREMKIGKEKQPFPHQFEAFGALSHTLPVMTLMQTVMEKRTPGI